MRNRNLLSVIVAYSFVLLPGCKYNQSHSEVATTDKIHYFNQYKNNAPEGDLKEGLEALSLKLRQKASSYSIYKEDSNGRFFKMPTHEVESLDLVNSVNKSEGSKVFYIEPNSKLIRNGLIVEARTNFKRGRIDVKLYEVYKSKLRSLSPRGEVVEALNMNWRAAIENYTTQTLDLSASSKDSIRKSMIDQSHKTKSFYDSYFANAPKKSAGLRGLLDELRTVIIGSISVIILGVIATAVLEGIATSGGTVKGFFKYFVTKGTIGNGVMNTFLIMGAFFLALLTLVAVVSILNPKGKERDYFEDSNEMQMIRSGSGAVLGGGFE